jgi:hypothetical protein
MIRRRGKDGYALLAALVIMALAAVFAATSVAAVLARQSVAAADRSADRAGSLERRALAAACLAARRGEWTSGSGSVSGASGESERWRARWSLSTDPSAAGWPAFGLTAEGASGRARHSVDAVVQLRQEPFACGLVITGDVEAAASLRADGSGLYCGGSVRGREWITFGAAGGPPAADDVHGDLWPQAGVHALGGIWVRGSEEHGGGVTPAPEDTDTHSAANAVMSAVSAPSADWVDTTDHWADDPGGAFERGVLRLDRIPSARGALDARSAGSGFIFWLSSGDAVVRVAGVRPPGWCPVLVVSDGDLALGDPSMATSFDGAVVTQGHVDVEGMTAIGGGLCAGTLRVAAPLAITVAPSWRTRPIPGLAMPVIVALDASVSAGN